MRKSGHLQARGPKTWRYHFSINGQRQKPLTLHGTQREAERQAALLYAKALENRPLPPARWTVAQLLRAWLADKLQSLGSDRSRFLYEYAVEHYWVPAIGGIGLRDYKSADLLEVKAQWLKTLSPTTVRFQWDRLVQAELWAVKHGYLPESPAQKVDRPAKQESRTRRYTVDEAMRLDAVLSPPYGLVVAFGLWAGLRIGEARGVRKADVDGAARVLYVRQQLARYRRRGQEVQPPKRGSVRTVEINQQLERHIVAQLEWLDTRKVHRLDDLLGVTLTGERLPETTIYSYLERVQVEAGVPRLVFHSLRHTYATLMREAGVPDLEIAASLGHKDTRQLVTLYGAHPDTERHSRMASRLDAFVRVSLPSPLPSAAGADTN